MVSEDALQSQAVDSGQFAEQRPDEDEDDPVVHEVNVFLARGLDQSLQLWQYPVRPAQMTYDAATIIQSRVKAKQQQVELTMALDTGIPNYDQSKGEQIALNVDGSNSRSKTADPDNLLYPSGLMDKHVLSSTKSVSNPDRYAVGILADNELHLTPLSGILTLRPDLRYLDKSDKTARAEGRPLQNDGDSGPDGGESGGDGGGDSDVKQVTVRFAKGDPDMARRLREKSFEYQMRKAEEEPWASVNVNRAKSRRWEEETQRLFCKKTDQEIVSLAQPPRDYLHALTKHPS